ETSTLWFDDAVVAEVGDARITEVQLGRATYMNTTIQQALSPDTAELIVQLFRPAILQQLIDTELAYQGARSLGVDFVGSRAAIAQAALNYVARDATVTDEQVREYYEANAAAFTVGPEAVVTQVELASQEAAAAFRAEVLGGADVAAAAAEHGGEVVEHGRVLPGTLEADIDTALFGTDAFEPIAGSAAEVSDVLVIARPVEEEDDAADAAGDEEADGAADEADESDAPAEAPAAERYVVLVAERTPESVRPLEDVRAQVENAVRATNRQRLQEEWLASLREQIAVRELVTLGGLPGEDAAFTV